MPFDAKGLDFLFENHLMDSRDWFHEHRDIYVEHVLRPLQQMVTDLAPCMLEIDPKFSVIPQSGKCISRLNRDTRFTKDKSLYRDHMWISFMRDKHEQLPGFYFEVSPRGYSYGCGYYSIDPEAMANMRQMILQDDPLYLEMLQAHKNMKAFGLYAERYKRPHYPNETPEKQFWLDIKCFGYESLVNEPKLLYSDKLADQIKKDFQELIPAYRFMIRAEEQRREAQQYRQDRASGHRPDFEW